MQCYTLSKVTICVSGFSSFSLSSENFYRFVDTIILKFVFTRMILLKYILLISGVVRFVGALVQSFGVGPLEPTSIFFRKDFWLLGASLTTRGPCALHNLHNQLLRHCFKYIPKNVKWSAVYSILLFRHLL